MSDAIVVLVTVPNGEEASRIAEAVVSDKLAACVNIVSSIESIYRWEGTVTRDHEVLMIIKTTDAKYSELEARVRALHSYSTPEVIALEISRGSQPYLNWIIDSTS